jgi:hypothetical protein
MTTTSQSGGITEKIPDKETLEYQEEYVIVLTVSKMKDLVDYTNKLYDIEEPDQS